uniref:Uncharacterized protein n=1 Tax=Tanacetum cinerariifolium TaxID=118510 RepID=A0A6L2JH27_TANCI|nr:hypothetical protein CTI12_AA475510 [Tanacetum cinerariifolium]
MQALLRARFSDLLAVDMKEIIKQRMFEYNSYKAHEDHKNLYEAFQKSLESDYSNQLLADLDEAPGKKRKKRDSPRTPSGSPSQQPPPPPPPPPLAGAFGAPNTSRASGSSQAPPPPSPSSIGTSRGNQRQGSEALSLSKTAASTPEISNKYVTLTPPPTDTLMHDDSTLNIQVHLSDDEATRDDHLPKANIRKDWRKPLPEVERPASLELGWTIPSSNMTDVENNWATALASTDVPPTEHSLFVNTEDMITFMNWKGSCPALSISKMKVASYPNFGHELLMSELMWIDDILSVVRTKAYSRYGYDYLSEMVLRRADLQEHTITEKDFKNLYPSDFEDLNMLFLQGCLDHLPGSINECFLLLSSYGPET